MGRGCILAILAAGLASPSYALDPERAIAQYLRTQWIAGREFPGGAVNGIAEADGYLWIGAEKGLVRFDGLTFRVFEQRAPVLGVVSGAEDDLWVRLEGSGLLRYRAGVFQEFDSSAAPANGVTAMGRGARGELLLARPANPLRYRAGRFEPVAPASAAGDTARLAIAIAETPGGVVWMGTRDSGAFFLRDGRVTIPPGLPDRKVNCILAGDGTDVWLGTDSGLVRWDGAHFTRDGIPLALRNTQVLALVRDREANIWAGAATGIARINARGVSVEPRPAPVTALFEDREGNLWTGGPQGIERYRETAFLTHPQGGGPIYADAANRTWFAPPAGGLRWLSGAATGRIDDDGLDRDVVYSLDGAPGELWIGRQRGGLTRLREQHSSFTSQTWTAAAGLAPGSVYAVRRARDGSVWAGTLSGGLSHLRDGRFSTYTTANGLASNSISAIEETPDGVMWFATPGGLHSFADGRWRIYTSQDGLPPGRINCLAADAAGVLWIGTGAGLVSLRDGRIHTPGAPLLDEVFGIAAAAPGQLWISTATRVVRSLDAGGLREFNSADGLPAGGGVRRNRSVVASPSGRVWFSLSDGLAEIDPARTLHSAPAIVHIQGVMADGAPLETAPLLRIPAARHRINFRFNALSLAVPERVRFRYRLDGFDRDWSEPSDAREAVYTNLQPGPYRFRVLAANSHGEWNSSEAAVALELTPAFWQTLWFRLSLTAAALLAIAGAWRVRLHQMNLRFEERLAERTRIAQDLHDTLLQGMLSASMQLHVAADAVPENLPARGQLDRVRELMQRVVDEGRTAVQGLRTVNELEAAFSRLRDELYIPPATEFRIQVRGRPTSLAPALRDEVYRIGREALANALRHAGAARVELVLEYAPAHLRLTVRDNGRGIDPVVLQSGRAGHWGLPGMRERAARIHARLNFVTRPGLTEVELTVPHRP